MVCRVSRIKSSQVKGDAVLAAGPCCQTRPRGLAHQHMASAAASILTRVRLPAALRCVDKALPAPASSTFQQAWEHLLGSYLKRTPSAVRAITYLDALGGQCYNDHVAMRSFVDSAGASGLAFLDRAFSSVGYAAQEDIVIPALPVNARWYEPPAETHWPKVFVSELRTAELPPPAAAIVYRHVDGFGYSGRGAGGRALSAALDAEDGAALARLLDEPPWVPTAAEVAAVREAEGASKGAVECALHPCAPAPLRPCTSLHLCTSTVHAHRRPVTPPLPRRPPPRPCIRACQVRELDADACAPHQPPHAAAKWPRPGGGGARREGPAGPLLTSPPPPAGPPARRTG